MNYSNKKIIIVLKRKFLLHKQKILISLFLLIPIGFIAHIYTLQEYFITYISELINASEHKDIEIMQLKEKLDLMEASNSKISVEVEVDANDHSFRNKILIGAGIGLLFIGLVAAGIYFFSGGSPTDVSLGSLKNAGLADLDFFNDVNSIDIDPFKNVSLADFDSFNNLNSFDFDTDPFKNVNLADFDSFNKISSTDANIELDSSAIGQDIKTINDNSTDSFAEIDKHIKVIKESKVMEKLYSKHKHKD